MVHYIQTLLTMCFILQNGYNIVSSRWFVSCILGYKFNVDSFRSIRNLFIPGLLLVFLLIFAMLMCRKRRRHLRKVKNEKKRQREAEREMELKTRSFRHNGYRLAFDNPYYDVLAAMALDDDVEEDYINPLCDLDSLMSHQESDGTVSSATECSIHKGESLQSVSYC